ncbi:hypothetical protein Hdeb2414_s0023g00636921 [Helianthus debilis subsp. tardiflorus]|nr:hypothetical protein HanLR1_Chr14g0548431 [Helianthus annuus]
MLRWRPPTWRIVPKRTNQTTSHRLINKYEEKLEKASLVQVEPKWALSRLIFLLKAFKR